MSSEIYFASNHHDLCQQYGTGAGFQFEFYCSRCHDTWRSPFEAYAAGRLTGWLNKGIGAVSGALGSVASELGNAADGLAGSHWGSARDAAFTRAISNAQTHFQRCARCTSYVCGRCFNPEQGLCFSCAPDTAAEMAAAKHRGLNDMVTERAYSVGKVSGQEYDVKTPRQLVCPHCKAETHGGKFCASCGQQLANQNACTHCQADLPQGAAFCPSCGQRQ